MATAFGKYFACVTTKSILYAHPNGIRMRRCPCSTTPYQFPSFLHPVRPNRCLFLVTCRSSRASFALSANLSKRWQHTKLSLFGYHFHRPGHEPSSEVRGPYRTESSGCYLPQMRIEFSATCGPLSINVYVSFNTLRKVKWCTPNNIYQKYNILIIVSV